MTFNLTSDGAERTDRTHRVATYQSPSRIVPMQLHAAELRPPAAEMPEHIDPVQWYQAMGHARQVCARFFRDGASPADALRAFGLSVGTGEPAEWGRAVTAIAHVMCAAPRRMAA